MYPFELSMTQQRAEMQGLMHAWSDRESHDYRYAIRQCDLNPAHIGPELLIEAL